jgi:hypothetical protein
LAKPKSEKKQQTKPLSAARIKKIHAVLSSAMGTAVKTKKLTFNPVDRLSGFQPCGPSPRDRHQRHRSAAVGRP